MSNWLPGLVGAIGLLVIAGFGLRALWCLCNPRAGAKARAAQRAQMPADYKITTRQDEIVCTSEGCFRVIDGEYVPFEKAA